MPTYILLTEQGIKDIKAAPVKLEKAAKCLYKTACQLTSADTRIGKHAYVAMTPAPNDEVAMSFLQSLSLNGDVRITTTKVMSD